MNSPIWSALDVILDEEESGDIAQQFIFIHPPLSIPAAWQKRARGVLSPYAAHRLLCGHIDLATEHKIIFFWPKNHVEALGLLGQIICDAPHDTRLIIAAEKDAGGDRVVKDFRRSGIEARIHSKHHCRIVDVQLTALQLWRTESLKWIDAANLQKRSDGFWTCPGLHGWNIVDKGSRILCDHIPSEMKSKVADFGCGYGFLTRHVLSVASNIESMDAIDHDNRALDACARNIEPVAKDRVLRFVWHDMYKQLDSEFCTAYDYIVMNPPFHTGATEDRDLGRHFIAQAATCLRPGGILLMVANRHLPYHEYLHHLFDSVSVVADREGFKIYQARKGFV